MGKLDLSGLRDIHLPEHGVGIFPIAVGWWVLICTPVVLFVMYKVIRYLCDVSVKLYALHELKRIFKRRSSDMTKVFEVSALMKRLAIKKYGADKVAHLYGKEWAEFIKSFCKSADAEVLQVIASIIYVKPENFKISTLGKVYDSAREFIRKNA